MNKGTRGKVEAILRDYFEESKEDLIIVAKKFNYKITGKKE